MVLVYGGVEVDVGVGAFEWTWVRVRVRAWVWVWVCRCAHARSVFVRVPYCHFEFSCVGMDRVLQFLVTYCPSKS